mgnify:CR=1 FL=1
MPARNGTGPMGQGARTGRGMGNCNPTKPGVNYTSTTPPGRTSGWGGRVLDATLGFLLRRRLGQRSNPK